MMRWCRTDVCFVFHSPLQKELVRIVPPSFTVMLCHRGVAHLPGRHHRLLLRQEKVVHRRIARYLRPTRASVGAPNADCDVLDQVRPPQETADALHQRCDGLPALGIGSVAESQGAAPPRQLELTPPGTAEFVICDHTIEFNFRDAKQYWGLEDFMNVTPTGVTNAANLSLFMVNVAYRLRADIYPYDPDYSVLDLKADCRGYKYVEETIKMLPEKPEPILLAKILNQVAGLGRIHAAQTSVSFS
jgi:hypothetical protein